MGIEIIDISNIYRFDSVPNPLVLSMNMTNFDSSTADLDTPSRDNYKQITKLENDRPENSAIALDKFDHLLKFYNQSEKNSKKDSFITRLNQIKVYVIVKPKTINNKNYLVLLPINNFENLSDKPVSRLYLHRDGLFEINANPALYYRNIPPGERRFYIIDDLLTTHGAFDSQLDIKIRNAIIETEDDILERKGLKGKLLGNDPNYYSSSEYEKSEYLPEIDPDPEIWRDDDKNSIWVQKYGIPKQDYEYDEAEMDNIMFNNSFKYFSGTEKYIVPVFESLADAEKLLITIFEDFLEPFRKKRLSLKRQDFFKLTKREQYMFLLPSSYLLNIEDSQIYDPLNLDFLDNFDQHASTKNSNFSPIFDQTKNWLAKRRLIRSYTRVEPPYRIENYDQNAYIPLSSTFLLSSLLDTKIVQISLGDFYEFWNQREFAKSTSTYKSYSFKAKIKNLFQNKVDNLGEILFIPNLGLEYSLSSKNDDSNRFLKYQQIFKKSMGRKKWQDSSFSYTYQLGKIMYLDEIEEIMKTPI